MDLSGAARVAAPGTMILVDPDLDAHRADNAATSRAKPFKNDAETRTPSARALAGFLREAQAAVRLRGMVSVLLTTDKEIRRLNRTFRGKNKATDVLSFPAAQPTQVSRARPGAPASQQVSGDLAISVETARRQAEEQGHSLAVEVKVLMLHGLLHLAGYDHEVDEGQMLRRERGLRARLGLAEGLIERAGVTVENDRSRYPTTLAAKSRRKDGAPGVRTEDGSAAVKKGSRLPTLAAKSRRKDGAPKIVPDHRTRKTRKRIARSTQGGVKESKRGRA